MTRFKTAFLVIATLLLTYTAIWYYLAHEGERLIEERLAPLRANGLNVEFENVSASGFPYRLAYTLEDVRIRYAQGAMRMAGQTDSLTLFTQPWNPNHVIILTDNINITLDWTAIFKERVRINLAAVQSSGHVAADGTSRFSLIYDNAEITSGRWERQLLAGEIHLQTPPRIARQTSSELRPPKLADIAISASTETNIPFVLTLEILGEKPPHPTARALSAWQETGGTFELTQMSVGTAENIMLSANGSFSLDETLRPIGAASLEFSDSNALQTILEGTGWFSGREISTLLENSEIEENTLPFISLMIQENIFLNGFMVGSVHPLVN